MLLSWMGSQASAKVCLDRTNLDVYLSGRRRGLVGHGTVQDCHRDHRIRNARNEDWLRSGRRS